ncbi:MAG: response regulator [Nitrospirales bacterium]
MILLVLHETKVRESISRKLQPRGYAVAVTKDRQETFLHVCQMPPSVILIDRYLKNPSGLEVLKMFRTQGYQGKVILLSGMFLRTEMAEAYS